MNKQTEVSNNVRRKLLKAMVYAPPVILGSMVATPRTVMGAVGQSKNCKVTPGSPPIIIVISSGTNACCPCVPGSTKFDPVKCAGFQCQKSCGVSCAPGQIATIKCKNFCKTCGFVPAGCRKGPCNCQWVPAKGKYKCI